MDTITAKWIVVAAGAALVIYGFVAIATHQQAEPMPVCLHAGPPYCPDGSEARCVSEPKGTRSSRIEAGR